MHEMKRGGTVRIEGAQKERKIIEGNMKKCSFCVSHESRMSIEFTFHERDIHGKT